jgi:hypothetical protein
MTGHVVWKAEVRGGKRRRVLRRPTRGILAALAWVQEVKAAQGLEGGMLQPHPQGGVVLLGERPVCWLAVIWPEARRGRRR